MPLYEYACQECGQESELLVRGSEPVACPECGSDHLTKLLSAPAAHSAGASDLPICGPAPSAGGGCGLPQCGMGRCQFE
jgi:putative FmdB family regulatory protein